MSAFEFFLHKGFTPVNKNIIISGPDTITVWAPTTSTRVFVTDLNLSNNTGGTIAFYWGNLAGSKIAEFLHAGSSSISPAIGGWECTAYDRTLFAKATGTGTDGWRVNVSGFELP